MKIKDLPKDGNPRGVKFKVPEDHPECSLKEAFLDGWDACAGNSPVDGASLQRIADYDKWKKGG